MSTQQQPSTSRSVLVTNYRKKDDSDNPVHTISEFFSFCGPIVAIDVTEEVDRKDYYRASITFESHLVAETAQLLTTSIIGYPDEKINVTLTETPSSHLQQTQAPAPAIPSNNYSASAIIEKLISVGYKLKDDSLHLAKDIDQKIRTTATPHIENSKNIIASHLPESVKTTGTVAIEVAQHKIHDATETLKAVGAAVTNTTQVAVDITGNVIHNATGATVDGIKQTGHYAIDVTTATIHNATEVTAGIIHNATEKTTTAIKTAGEAINTHVPPEVKTIGAAVATTGQVAYDVTTLKLQEGVTVVKGVAEHTLSNVQPVVQDTLKTVGNAVTNTSQVAYDVTGNKIHNVTNATIEATQIAAATVASVYEANKSTVSNVGGAALNIASSVAATTTATLSHLFGSAPSPSPVPQNNQ